MDGMAGWKRMDDQEGKKHHKCVVKTMESNWPEMQL